MGPDLFTWAGWVGGFQLYVFADPTIPSHHIPPLTPNPQVSICQACGLTAVNRLERSRRYLVWTKAPLTDEQAQAFVGACGFACVPGSECFSSQ